MSEPEKSGGFDRLPHKRCAAHGHRSAHAAAEAPARQALARLYTDHYGTLVRMAALLTGDASCADDVAVDSFAALCSTGLVEADDRALSYLRRQVVIRSRQALHHRAQRATRPLGFGNLPVVLGLMALRPAEREAVVLIGYLDLTEWQAAAAAGVTQKALRRDLATAMKVLGSRIPADLS